MHNIFGYLYGKIKIHPTKSIPKNDDRTFNAFWDWNAIDRQGAHSLGLNSRHNRKNGKSFTRTHETSGEQE